MQESAYNAILWIINISKGQISVKNSLTALMFELVQDIANINLSYKFDKNLIIFVHMRVLTM